MSLKISYKTGFDSIQDILTLYRIPTLVVSLGVILSIVAFYIAMNSNLSRLEVDFDSYGDLQNKSLERIFTLYRDFGALILPYAQHPRDRENIPELMESSLREGGLKAMFYVPLEEIITPRNEVTPRYVWVSDSHSGWPDRLSEKHNQQFLDDLRAVAQTNKEAISRVSTAHSAETTQGYLALLSWQPRGVVFVQLFSPKELMLSLMREKPDMVSNIYFYRKLENKEREIWFKYAQEEHPMETPQGTNELDPVIKKYPYYYARRIQGFDNPLYLLMTPSTRYMVGSAGTQPWLVLSLSISLTCAIGMLLFYYASRRAEVERLVEVQTAKLRETNEQLERFAYIASHDLKAPLRAIDSLSGWIEEDIGDQLEGETKENLDLLRARVKRMEKLLDDLLAYSRAGVIKPGEQKIVSGEEMLEDIRLLLNIPKGFTLRMDDRFKRGRFPKMPLQQVMHNLVSNAIKHHDREEGTISLSMQEHNNFYTFGVCDDGPGIPKEYHEKVFEMFQTLKPRDEVEGSGMGLAMVKKIIERFGGTITIESHKRGTSIKFTWPKDISETR